MLFLLTPKIQNRKISILYSFDFWIFGVCRREINKAENRISLFFYFWSPQNGNQYQNSDIIALFLLHFIVVLTNRKQYYLSQSGVGIKVDVASLKYPRVGVDHFPSRLRSRGCKCSVIYFYFNMQFPRIYRIMLKFPFSKNYGHTALYRLPWWRWFPLCGVLNVINCFVCHCL